MTGNKNNETCDKCEDKGMLVCESCPCEMCNKDTCVGCLYYIEITKHNNDLEDE